MGKVCPRCKQEKDLIVFAKNCTSKSGYSCYCRECASIKRNESSRLSYRKHIIERRLQAQILNKKRKTYKRLWYQKNKERVYAKARLWLANNKIKRKAYARRYRQKNLELVRERCRKIQKLKYKNNPEKYRNLAKKYREINPEIVSNYLKNYKINMGNGYISQIIRRRSILETKDIPSEILDLWRLNLTLKRLKREKFKC